MTPNRHYGCALVQADNRFDLERTANQGDAGDLFGALFAPAFGPGTAPASPWRGGAASGLKITSISAPRSP